MSGQGDDSNVKIFSSKDGFDIGHVKGVLEDSTGLLWLFGYESRQFTNRFQQNRILIQRFNGASFTTFNLPLSSEYRFDEGPFVDQQSGGFYMPLVHKKTAEKTMWRLNPYEFEISEVVFEPFNSEKDDHYYFQAYHAGSYYFTVRRSDSVFVHARDDSLRLEKEWFMLTTSEIEMGNVHFVPIENAFLWSVMRSPIVALDKENEKKVVLRKTRNRLRDKNASKFATIHQYFLINDSVIIQTMDDEIESGLYLFDSDQFAFVPLSGNQDFRQLPPQHNTFTEVLKKDPFSDQYSRLFYSVSNKYFEYWRQRNGEFEEVYRRPKTNGENITYYHEESNQLFICESNSLRVVNLGSSKTKVVLPQFSVRGILPVSDEKMIVATERHGAFFYDENKGQTTELDFWKEGQKTSLNFSRNLFLADSMLWSNDDVGVVRINLHSRSMKSYWYYPVECMIQSDQYLFCGTRLFGLLLFDKQQEKYIVKAELPDVWMLDLIFNSDSTSVFSATDKGLYKIDISTGKMHHFVADTSIADEQLLCLSRAGIDQLMVGSNKGRVYLFDETTNSFRHIFTDALTAPIASILSDGKGTYFFNSFNGIIEWNDVDGQIDRISQQDGLSDNECNRYSAYMRGDGRMYVGTVAGLNVLSLGAKQRLNRANKINLIQAAFFREEKGKIETINGRSQLDRLQHGIILPPDKGYLSMGFHWSDYIETPYVQLQFRLNNAEWRNMNQQGQIELIDLGPGQYTIDVRAIDELEAVIGNQLTYQITVRKFLYQQWWVWLLTTILVAVVSYYLIQKAKQEEKLQRKFSRDLIRSEEQQRQRISRDIHDAAGQDLILLTQQLELKKDEKSSNLARKVLAELRSISHNLHPFVLNKYGLSAALQMELRKLEEQSDFFVTENIEDIDDLFDETNQLHIYRLVQESIANALKHAEATALTIEIKRNGDEVHLWIEDNGKGFPVFSQTDKKPSVGLRTIKERVRMLKGRLELQKGEQGGAVLSIHLPIQQRDH